MQRVFVGDVQGCDDELADLLARLRAELGEPPQVWLVGDLVNRGPASLEVLRRVRRLRDAGRARAVLGNHEVHLLEVFYGVRELVPGDTFRDVLRAPDVSDWVEWLRRLPLVETGAIGGQGFAMLHAAAHPEWSLDELAARAACVAERLASPDARDARALLAADPGADEDADALGRLTSCRSVVGSSWSNEPPDEHRNAWHQHWLARGHGYGVVYGHWSLQGLHVERGLRGLDTGCVHHGRDRDGFLTAWLPDSRALPGGGAAFDVPDDRFVSVPARRRYYPPTASFRSA